RNQPELLGHRPGAGSGTLAATLRPGDRKSTRLNSSHLVISYAVFCLKKNKDDKRINAAAPHAQVYSAQRNKAGKLLGQVLCFKDRIFTHDYPFFFKVPAPTKIYHLPLQAPLPI